jgi:CTP synthase
MLEHFRIADANSTEMNEDNKVSSYFDLMEEQKSITDKGGTMRLGSWKCDIAEGTLAHTNLWLNTN